MKRMRAEHKKGEVPGYAQLIVRGGYLAHFDSFGLADAASGSRQSHYGLRTVIRLFSMTKPLTAVALLQAAEEGKLSLDDPVSKYLPSWRHVRAVRHRLQARSQPSKLKKVRRPPTLRQLAMHTSGLSYGAFCGQPPVTACERSYQALNAAVDAGDVRSLEEFCDELATLPLRSMPTRRWEYSHGFDVLGRVLEVVDGKPLSRVLQDRIFSPLRLRDTGFAITRSSRNSGLATLYGKDARGRPSICLDSSGSSSGALESAWAPGRECPIQSGGGFMGSSSRTSSGATSIGGVVSTLGDYSQFVLALANHGTCPQTGAQLLKTETAWDAMRDWLPLKSVSGERRRSLPGFHDQGRSGIGWCIFGQASAKLDSVAAKEVRSAASRKRRQAPEAPEADVWMGGYAGTFFAIDRTNDLVVVHVMQVNDTYDYWGQVLWEVAKEAVVKRRQEALAQPSPKAHATPQKRRSLSSPPRRPARAGSPAAAASSSSGSSPLAGRRSSSKKSPSALSRSPKCRRLV